MKTKLISILIFFLPFGLYLTTMAPSITVGDAGELCATSVILGVAHSPGYPLFSLIGKIFTVLLPFGSLAYRINLISPISAALTLVLLYFVVQRSIRLSKQSSYYLIAIAFVALSPAFWRSAIQTEVFMLNALFAVLIVYACQKNWYYFPAFIFGLGLGNHHTLIFVGPLFLALVYKNPLITKKEIINMALFFLGGLSVYLFLPIRSFKNPGLDWGNPETPYRLWRVFSRADYGSLSLTVGEKLEKSVFVYFDQITRLFKDFSVQITLLGILFGAWGAYVGLKRKYKFSKTMIFIWILIGPAFFVLANLPFTAEINGVLERFYVLFNIFWIFPLAWGISYLHKLKKPVVLIVLTVLSANILYAAINNFKNLNWRQNYLAYDYGRNVLKTLSKNSIFFMDGGDDTFYSMAYLCFAEKRRPDLEHHDRGGLVFRNIYGNDFRKLSKDDKEKRRKEVEKTFLKKRPIFFSTFNKKVMNDVEMKSDGVLYRPKFQNVKDSIHFYSLRNIFDRNFDDYRNRALAPIYTYFLGIRNKKTAGKYYRYSNYKWPEILWLNSNMRMELLTLAYDEYTGGNNETAIDLYNTTLKIYPDEVSAYVNLGVIEEKRGNPQKAKEYYGKAILTDPTYADSYFNLAVIYWHEKNWDEVIKQLRKNLIYKPDDKRARHYLHQAMLRKK